MAAVFVCLSCTTSCRAQLYNQDSIRREMNMAFEFDPSYWQARQLGSSDYFWNWTDALVSYYATNEECVMDALMLIDANKAGMVAHYVDAMKKYTDSMMLNGDKSFFACAGENTMRVAGQLVLKGEAQDVGALHSRSASGEYENHIYYVVNNRNLLQIVVSAPIDSWRRDTCASAVDSLIGSIKLFGDPDPREKGVAEYYGIDISGDPGAAAGHSANTARTSPDSAGIRRRLDQIKQALRIIQNALDESGDNDLADQIQPQLKDISQQIEEIDASLK
jgi:hypothetical protein